jgi:hypothetical protein
LCRVPDRLAGKSPKKQREIYWEEKRRELGLYEEWKRKEENGSGEKVCQPTGKENTNTFNPSCSTNYTSVMTFQTE